MTDAPDQSTEAPDAAVERIADLRALHVKMHESYIINDRYQEWDTCQQCSDEDWPCATAALFAEIDRLRVTHAEFARFVAEATEQAESRERALREALEFELRDAEAEIGSLVYRMPVDRMAYYADGSPRVKRLRALLAAPDRADMEGTRRE